MSGHKITLKGFRIDKSGKVKRIAGYGLDTSAKLRQKKSKRVKVKRKTP